MVRKVDSYRGVEDLVGLLGGWSGGSGSLQRKLTDALREQVESGGLAPGERLPSERQLAAALAVSRTTVVAAYDALRGDGLLESRQGSGTRVSAELRPARAAWAPGVRNKLLLQRLLDGPGELISLTAVTAEGLPEVPEAIREVVREDLPALMADGGYHPRGMRALRQEIANHYTHHGLPTSAEQIVVTTGAQQALALVSELYLVRGSPVVVESPSFAGCLDLMRAAGAELLCAPLDGEGIDAREVREMARTREPHLMYVMPGYHNPTGVLMSANRRRQIAEIAARHGIPVLEDYAYTGLRAPEEPPPLAALAPAGAEVLTVGSLAKVAWAGIRIGWLRAPEEIADRIGRRKVLQDLGSPLLDQAVATRLLPRLDQLAKDRSELLERRLDFLTRRLEEHLPNWRWRRPDGGSALWIRLPDTSARVFGQIALRHGVEIVPGTAMTARDSFEDHFRLPFGFAEEVLEEVVNRLARAWSELRRLGPRDDGPMGVVV